MEKRTTTVRMPEELAERADVVARGRVISINSLMLEALEAEIDRVRHDEDFMAVNYKTPKVNLSDHYPVVCTLKRK